MPLILLIIGVVLIVYNYRAIKREQKDKSADKEFDISFQSVLQDNKEELNDYKMDIGLLRKDIAESLTELQEEIFYIKKDIHLLKDNNYHLLKDNNSHLLKNKDSLLKNNSEMYENKEGLENIYNIDEKETGINIDKPDEGLEKDKNEADNIDNINQDVDANSILDSEINEDVISEIDFSAKEDSNKTASIKKLLREGLTEDQICHELSVSKGEVLLVKGLFKK